MKLINALIIEDQVQLAHIFSIALQNIDNVNTTIIRDGYTAVKYLEQQTPDIIILDIHLPRISGETILNQIRRNERFTHTKIVAVTADASSAMRIESEGLATVVLKKPISMKHLVDIVTDLSGASD